jgi:hypothetical protein
MDELFDSGIKLAYPPEYNFIFEYGDETLASKVQRNRVNCSSYEVCVNWAKYHKNVSILMPDMIAEVNFASGNFVGENSEPLLRRLEDGVVFSFGKSMIMVQGDPRMRRVTEIVDRVFEAGIYNYWISLNRNMHKILSRKVAILLPLDEYYSFNLYHMQPAFYLLMMGCCLSALCCMVEMLYNCLLCKRY